VESRTRYLITGGAGFIGINLADRFLARGDEVAILDNFARSGCAENVRWLRSRHRRRVPILRADVRSYSRILREAVARAEVVIHLAAQVAVTRSVQDPRSDFEVNARGTLNVLEAARLAPRKPVVLYASTNKVYGAIVSAAVVEETRRYAYASLPDGVSESCPLDLHSPYGCSKGSGDQYAVDYARIYGLRSVVFRQSCIYGPRQFGLEDQGWVAWFAIRALQGLPITLYGDGKQVRDVLYVDDLADAYDAAVRQIDVAAGQVYNVGGGPGNTVSLLELMDLLAREFGRPLPHAFADWRPGDQRVYVSDIRKAKRELGWEPKMPVAQGVGELVRWLRDNPGLVRPEREAVAV
jgi:CDP-paratose 2-epimerase